MRARRLLPAWQRHAGALLCCAAAAALSWLLRDTFDAAGLVLVFLLAVVASASAFGRGPAWLASAVSVLLFNLLFVPPQWSLAVADERDLFTFGVMGLVGALVAELTARLRQQADEADLREQRTGHLYELARILGQALQPVQVDEAVRAFAQAQWQAGATLRLGREAMSEASSSASASTLVLPLQAPMAVRGHLTLQRHPAVAWTAAERALAVTCATLAAGALERIHYIEVAQASAVEIEGERLRNTLLSALSHDLRTPLAALVAQAESLPLLRPAPAPEQTALARAMAASARRMSAMVHNLLDLARLESGPVRLDRQWLPLEEVVGAALQAVGADDADPRSFSVWPAPTHPVTVDLPDDLPLVPLDPVLFERVLVNLLENAFKHTPAGTAVGIQAREVEGQLELRVQDRGPGWPAGRGDEVFLKFERGQRESATPGFGLGLALCRAIVQAHGGRITAEAAPGGGAAVVIRLPLGVPPALAASPPLSESFE